MKNVFRDEAEKAVNQGGVLGDLYKIYEFASFCIVDDYDMTPEEKLKNATELLDLEMGHYEKQTRRNGVKTTILAILMGFVSLGLIIVAFADNTPVEQGVPILIFFGIVLLVALTFYIVDIENDNKLVLFWVAYTKKLLDENEYQKEVSDRTIWKLKKIIAELS